MKLKGLKRYNSGGTYYVYHRETGIALPAELPEDHPNFLAAYMAACKNDIPPKPGPRTVAPDSVEHVAGRYMASHGYRKLSPAYQDVRRRDINRLLAASDGAIARLAFSSIRDVHLRRQLDDMEVNPANERLKTWRALAAYALDHRIIRDDPTIGIKQLSPPPGDGHVPWTFKDIERFRSHWNYGTEERLAFELHYWGGGRISDTVGLGPGNVDEEGWLVFVQKKTKSEVSVPFDRELPAFALPSDLEHLKRALAAMGPRPETFMRTEYGEARSAKGAASWFSKAASKAGLPAGRTSHGLRKSRMILHAERGATLHQIAAWSGHETLKEIERYTKRANKRRMLSAPSVLETGNFLKAD